MIRIRMAACLAAVGMLPLIATGQSSQRNAVAYYVGHEVCRQCHGDGAVASACTLEDIPRHDKAYQRLLEPRARDIAALNGIVDDPRNSRVCLYCHSTAADSGARWCRETFQFADGVQCEACHDAGSLHVDRYQSAEGPSDEGDKLIRSGDRWWCKDCHRPRPSHDRVVKEGYQRSKTDQLYKTPINLTSSPDGKRLYVVCENSNSLIEVHTTPGRPMREVAVGRRPHDAAISPDGKRLFVTNRLDDSASVIDLEDMIEVARVPVGDDPHGVLVEPRGQFAYVLNTAEDSISVIDISSLRETHRLVAGRHPWSLALHPDNSTLFITNDLPDYAPFREPASAQITVVSLAENVVSRRQPVTDANMLEGIAAVPDRAILLFTLTKTKNLVPLTRLAQGWTFTYGLGIIREDGHVDQALLDEPNAAFPDPMDVAVSPDGRHALVTSGGSNQVAVVDIEELLQVVDHASVYEREMILPNHLGVSGRFVVKRLPVGRNPRGVCFSPDGRRAYVANALDDTLSVIDASTLTIMQTIELGGPTAVTSTRRGERLFHSASATFGRHFSCRSCHPDGHINGLTFDIEADGLGMEPVDNRSLRGILDTAPFKWNGKNPTLDFQCGPRLAVFFNRLAPYTPDELGDLTTYMCAIEQPPNRYRDPGGLTPAQRRGKAIFERDRTNQGAPIPRDKRCINCHNGPYKNSDLLADVGTTMWFDAPIDVAVVDVEDLSEDVEEHGELGLYYFKDTGTPTRAFDAAHLINIYDSAPYLHNGAARTLQEIWTRYDVLGQHGMTADLTRRQFNDLIDYLLTL